MKLKNAMLLNFRMTKHLRKASPNYMKINILWAVIGSVGNILQILLYQKFVDFVIYRTPKLLEVVIWFLFYHVFCGGAKILGYWVTYKFNEREKVKICQYYKKLMYSESTKKKLEYYNSGKYLDILYNAIYNEGTCLFSFTDSLCNFLSSIITFASVTYLFGRLHIIFVVGALIAALKNCILTNLENKIKYNMHVNNLEFERCNTYIYNIFYKKEFARELKMYSIGDYFIEKFKTIKALRWKDNRKLTLKKDFIKFLKETMDLIIYIINIIILVKLLINKEITVGEFSLVLSSFTMLVGYLERIFIFIPEVHNNANYINDILKIVDCNDWNFPEVKHVGKNLTHDPMPMYVKVEHLGFSYDGKEEILKDICIELPLNKKIAIVGENGSGKSTFIKVLLGLYTPCKGKVEYFYSDKSIQSSRELFSMMLQDYKVFPLSIWENIYPEANENDMLRVNEAICFAGLQEKINQLSDGIYTVLTGEFLENGVKFSGGEQQKLAIARTYAKNNPILIFDEPSANLDPIAENELIDKINHITRGKSVIMITHNLAYTRNVDLIYFFAHGKVVEFGSPKKLIMKKGYYEKMLRKQMERMERKDEIQY